MKEFLSQNNIAFEDRNVSENEQYMNEIRALGASSVPVLKVGDEVVIGNQRDQITQLLQSRGLFSIKT